MDKFIIKIVPLLWDRVSPEFKASLDTAAVELESAAKQSDNQYDGLAAMLLKVLISTYA